MKAKRPRGEEAAGGACETGPVPSLVLPLVSVPRNLTSWPCKITSLSGPFASCDMLELAKPFRRGSSLWEPWSWLSGTKWGEAYLAFASCDLSSLEECLKLKITKQNGQTNMPPLISV